MQQLLGKFNGKSITGLLVAALFFVFNLCGVNISDLDPAYISGAIANFVNAVAGLVSIGFALWGHIQLAQKHADLVGHVEAGVSAGKISPDASAAKAVLPLVLALGLLCSGLIGCAGQGGYIGTVLDDIKSATAKLSASGALPKGRTTDVVSDASTISNALETINTGNGLTLDQANAIAASFKSNASTTGYIQLAAAVSDVLVPFVNNLISQGKSPAEVQSQTTQVLSNLAPAVQDGIILPPAVDSTGATVTTH